MERPRHRCPGDGGDDGRPLTLLPLSFQTTNQHPTMTRDLATALLNRAADGAQLLEILESIATDLETQGIEETAAHYAAISAPTSEPIAF